MTAQPGNKLAIVWKPEHDAALRKHLARGLSLRECAYAINEQFGTSYSRNAAIGRSHRLGEEPKLSARDGNRMRDKMQAKLEPIRKYSPRPRVKPQVEKPKMPTSPLDQSASLNLPLLELKDKQCRWATSGDRGQNYRFCGHRTYGDSWYCGFHLGISLRCEAA